MTDIQEDKSILRRTLLEKIRSLDPSYTETADRAILATLFSLPEYKAAPSVFCFYGTQFEIQTRPFLEQVLADRKLLAVPKCISGGIMQAKLISSLSELHRGYFGLFEPDENAPTLSPDRIGLAVIPCLSCDHRGNRIGRGGGYYDTYFQDLPQIPCALICREQVMSNEIARFCEPHDLRFTPVISECGLYS